MEGRIGSACTVSREWSLLKPGAWNMVAKHREPSAPRASETRADEAQQTEDVFAGVVFVLRMYVCPLSKKLKVKLMHFFPLKTLPSGTQITVKDENLHAQSGCFFKGLKTVRHCWGRTAAAARWTDRSWHLL